MEEFVLIGGIILGLLTQLNPKLNKWSESLVSKYLVFIAIPLLLYVSFQAQGYNFWTIIIVSLIIQLICMCCVFLAAYFSKLKPAQKGTFQIAAGVGAYGFLGIPLAYDFFGDQAAVVVGLFAFVSIPLLLVVNISLAGIVSGKIHSFSSMVKQKLWISLGVVIMLLVLNVSLPQFVVDIAHWSTPLSLFVVGAAIRFKEERFWHVLLLIPRIIIPPIVAFAVAFTVLPQYAGFFAFVAAMPCAIAGSSLAKQYGYDDHLAASLTALSTLLVIPLLFLLKLVGIL